MIEFRWVRWDREDGQPPFGAIPIGSGAQAYTQVLQYRQVGDLNLMGAKSTAWSEWKNT